MILKVKKILCKKNISEQSVSQKYVGFVSVVPFFKRVFFFWLKKVLRKQGVRILLEIVLGSTKTNDLLSSNPRSFYHNSCNLPDMYCPQNIYLYFLKFLLTGCGGSKNSVIWEPLKKLPVTIFLMFSRLFECVPICFHDFIEIFE